MACSPACGVFHAYADGISDMQASETIQLYLIERQEIETDSVQMTSEFALMLRTLIRAKIRETKTCNKL